MKRYREDMVVRKQKEREIDAKLRELEAQLRTELDALPPAQVGLPPAPYEAETLVGINAIRKEEMTEG